MGSPLSLWGFWLVTKFIMNGPHMCARTYTQTHTHFGGIKLGWGRPPHMSTLVKMIFHFCLVPLQDSACEHSFLFLSNVPNNKTSVCLGRSTVIITVLACLWKPQGRQESNLYGWRRSQEHTSSHSAASGEEGLQSESLTAGTGGRRGTEGVLV